MMAVAKLHAAIRAAFKILNLASLCLMEPEPSGGFARTSSPSYYDMFDLKVMHSIW